MTHKGTREFLRRQTLHLHQQLEDLLPITRRVDPETYRDHLRFLLSFHQPLEDRLKSIEGLAERVPSLDLRWKTDKLRSDLGAEGAATPEAPHEMLPPTDTPGRAMGVLYVLEGATLGAHSLLKELRKHGVVPGPYGESYMESYGQNARDMWRSFCQALEEIDDSEVELAAAGARATFESLADWRRHWVSEAWVSEVPA